MEKIKITIWGSIALLVVLLCSSCHRKTYTLYSGKVVTSNSSPIMVGSYKKGFRHGKWYYLYDDNVLGAIGRFRNGYYDGTWTEYLLPEGRIERGNYMTYIPFSESMDREIYPMKPEKIDYTIPTEMDIKKALEISKHDFFFHPWPFYPVGMIPDSIDGQRAMKGRYERIGTWTTYNFQNEKVADSLYMVPKTKILLFEKINPYKKE